MTNVTKRLLMVAAMCGLSSSPAGALLLCQNGSTGEYTPDACDLILPIEPSQHAHECDATDWGMWFTKEQGADPVCSAYWDREMAVEMWLWHETEPGHRTSAPQCLGRQHHDHHDRCSGPVPPGGAGGRLHHR